MSFKLTFQGQEKVFEKKVQLKDLIDNKDKSLLCQH